MFGIQLFGLEDKQESQEHKLTEQEYKELRRHIRSTYLISCAALILVVLGLYVMKETTHEMAVILDKTILLHRNSSYIFQPVWLNGTG